MNRFRSYLVIFLLCHLSLPAEGQVPELINDPEFRSSAKAAVDSIYNFNMRAADAVLEPWKKRHPDHPVWTLMEGMKFWWEVVSDLEDTSHDEKFYHMMKKADYESSRLLRKEPAHADALIVKAASNGYLARQHANRGEWVRSLNYGRKAMSAHDYLMETEPGLADLKLAEGLKLYYLDYLPEAYPLVKTVSWTLPDGDKGKGLELLRDASEEAVFARAEASYFLGNINYNYEKNYRQAAENFRRLYEKYPNNNYYARLLVRNYYRMKRYGEALQVIDSALARWEQQSLPFRTVLQEELLMWKGRVLERLDRKREALKNYRRAFALGRELPETGNRTRHIMAGYFSGKLLFERGEYADAESYLSRVLESKSKSPYKKQAEKLLFKVREQFKSEG